MCLSIFVFSSDTLAHHVVLHRLAGLHVLLRYGSMAVGEASATAAKLPASRLV